MNITTNDIKIEYGGGGQAGSNGLPLRNGIANPSGELGATNWSGTGVTVQTRNQYMAANPTWTPPSTDDFLVFSGTGNATIYSNAMRALPSTNYPKTEQAEVRLLSGTSVSAGITAEFYRSDGLLLGTGVPSYSEGGAVTTGGWTRVIRDQGHGYTGGTTISATAKVRLDITATGAWTVAVRKGFASENYDHYAGNYDTFYPWYDITKRISGLRIRRGLRPAPPTFQLEVGTCNIEGVDWTVNDYDFINYSNVRLIDVQRKNLVRVRAKVNGVWEHVFEGTIEQMERNDLPDRRYFKFVAVDAAYRLAHKQKALAKSGNFKQRIDWILDNEDSGYAPPVPSVITCSAATTTVANLSRQDADQLDQLIIATNTNVGTNGHGWTWVDRHNVLRGIDKGDVGAFPASSATPIFRDKNALRTGEAQADLDKSVFYTVSNFDTNQSMQNSANEVTVQLQGLGATSGNPYSLTYGPYLDGWLQMYMGILAGSLTINSGNAWDAAYNHMAMWRKDRNNPPAGFEYFQFDGQKRMDVAAPLDVFDPIRIYWSGGSAVTYTRYRVTGIQHDITPKGWITRVETRPALEEVTPSDHNSMFNWTGNDTYNPQGVANVIPT